MLHLTQWVIPFGFAFLVVHGALSDLTRFRIPNWVSYALVLLFGVHAFLGWLDTPYLPSLELRLPPLVFNFSTALIVFVVSAVFWKLRYIGGGDVKYLTATSLWMGPAAALPFIILLTGLAIGFVLVLKLLGTWGFLVQGARLPMFAKQLFAKLQVNELPYGFPIGMAALIMIPKIFGF
ncbi:prepilin peptidase [Aestuariivirga sp.]|uniref:A24 family peptidase n=1 Tax=Aestuariivirga sp. TaxID=2650926 RepID=UPI003919706E